MPKVIFSNQTYQFITDENLLDGLLKRQVDIPYSCKNGVCHSCLLKLIKGPLPLGSQCTLSQDQIKQQFILACQTKVIDAITITPIQRLEIPAIIAEIIKVDPITIKLTLSLRFSITELTHKKIFLSTANQLSTTYKIHSLYDDGYTLTLLIERQINNIFSRWVHDVAEVNTSIMLHISQK